jgi:EEF1A N-terminal glycine/lysine methyltransferase
LNTLYCFPELSETEAAHREALIELENMRSTMARMEQEREDMMAEVEAQIELALTSMTANLDLDDDDDDNYGSRPQSVMSSRSRPRSRRPSDAMSAGTHLRSIATDSTLAEAYKELDQDAARRKLGSTLVEENEEEEPPSPVQMRRFSISEPDLSQDGGMRTMDEGISEKSDKIAEKVMQIQQKVGSSHGSGICQLLTDSHCSPARRRSRGRPSGFHMDRALSTSCQWQR